MDGLSLAASVIAVIQLTGSCLKLSRRWIGPSEFGRSDLTGMMTALYEFNGAIKTFQTHLEIYEDDEARLSVLDYLKPALERCKETLNTLKDFMEHTGFIGKHLMGPKFDRKLKLSLKALDRAKELFMLALHADQQAILYGVEQYIRTVAEDLRDIYDIVMNNGAQIDRLNKEQSEYFKQASSWQEEVTTTLERLRENGDTACLGIQNVRREQEDYQRQTILNWVTPIDYAPQQSDFLSRRQEGTGQWLLDSAKFHTWVEIKKQTLFCPGIPGAGKTILTSIVVNDLISRFHGSPNTSIAYIYCNFNQQEKQTVSDLLAGLLKQLAENQPSLPESVKDLYNHHIAKRTRPSLEEILRVLELVTAISSRVFLIVDALDECRASDGCRTRFLLELFNLQTRYGANIFATSRFIPEIINQFKGSISLEIRASTDDVERYLEDHMGQLPFFVQQNQLLQREIKQGISKAVDGMFLLAQIYLALLDDKLTLNDTRNTLRVFQEQDLGSGEDQKAQALAHAYEQTMERINGQKSGLKNLAIKVLLWITCAKRQLTASELQHALATKVGKSKLDQGDLPHIEDIVSVCSGLVTVDKESNIIRLVHYTTQEYFQRTRERWFPNAESEITAICITYLSFASFESGFCETYEAFTMRLCSNSLYRYAAHNWRRHARKAPTLSQKVIDFLKSEAKVEALGQVVISDERYSPDSRYAHKVPRHMRGLHLAAYFGLEETMHTLLSCTYGPDLIDGSGRTPLSYAAEKGHRAVVKLLLDSNANVDSMDTEWGRTPLSYAAERGHRDVVKLLLDSNANVDSMDTEWGRTPLSYAAERGHGAVVKLLLDQRADIELMDGIYNSTPILWAAWKGKEDVVKLLLENNAQPEPRNFFHSTPLSLAAEAGHSTVVKLLLDNGVNTELADDSGRTPLSYAAENGHDGIVQLLLNKRADIASKDNEG